MGRLDDLIVLREQLQQWVDEAPVDKKSPLVAQYRATLEEIATLEPKKAVGDGIDEITARRAARRSEPAPSSPRAKRQG